MLTELLVLTRLAFVRFNRLADLVDFVTLLHLFQILLEYFNEEPLILRNELPQGLTPMLPQQNFILFDLDLKQIPLEFQHGLEVDLYQLGHRLVRHPVVAFLEARNVVQQARDLTEKQLLKVLCL